MTTLLLKRRLNSLWYLEVKDTGTMISGPHRWGTVSEAMRAARAFASTWSWQVVLELEHDDPDYEDTIS